MPLTPGQGIIVGDHSNKLFSTTVANATCHLIHFSSFGEEDFLSIFFSILSNSGHFEFPIDLI